MRGTRALTRRGLAVLGLALLPAACASPEPSLYRLLPVPGSSRRTRQVMVELRQVGLPGYLDRPEIIRAGEGARLRSLGNERWAEPLGDLLGSALAENLALRLPDATVVTEGGALRAEGDVVVEVDVQRFEAGRSDVVELVAQVAVRNRANRDRRETRVVRLRSPAAGPGTPALVAAMSQAVAGLADAVAAMVGG